MKNNKLNFLLMIISLVLLAVFIGACSDYPANNSSNTPANGGTNKPDPETKWRETFAKEIGRAHV